MTVRELIEKLKEFPPNMKVVVYDTRLYNFVSELRVEEHADVAMMGAWLEDQTILVIE